MLLCKYTVRDSMIKFFEIFHKINIACTMLWTVYIWLKYVMIIYNVFIHERCFSFRHRIPKVDTQRDTKD